MVTSSRLLAVPLVLIACSGRADDEGLVARARAIPDSTPLGLPMLLIVELENRGTGPVTVRPALSIDTGRMEVVAEGPDGKRRAVETFANVFSVASLTLERGEILRVQEWVMDSSGGTDFFPAAGRYTLHVRLRPHDDEQARITAAPVPVEVREPIDEEREAAALLAGDMRVQLLGLEEREWGTRLAIRDKMERLSREYGNTPYGAVGTLLLAKCDAYRGHTDRAIGLLEDLRSRGTPEALRWETDRVLVELYADRGDREKARKALERLPRRDLPRDLQQWHDAMETRLAH